MKTSNNSLVLVNETTRAPIKIGEKFKGTRGEVHTVQGWAEPRSEASTGRVSTNRGEYYPSVIGAVFVPASEVKGAAPKAVAKKAPAKKSAVKFSPAELKTVRSAIVQTWQTVGHDVEAGCEEAGEPVSNGSAIECCLDHVSMYADSKEAEALLKAAYEASGYGSVLAYLTREIVLA